MIKKLTCIECPVSCVLSVDIENCKVIKVAGNECPKGLEYGVTEIENPVRILTSAVSAEGLDLKIVPVRTSGPIPKADMLKAMDEVKKVRLSKPLKAGDPIIRDFLGMKVDLVSTRDAKLIDFPCPNQQVHI